MVCGSGALRSGLCAGKGSADGAAVFVVALRFRLGSFGHSSKWYDMRTGQRGGGGIDLVMYLLGVDFVAAVNLLLVGADAVGQR